jgi:CRISPR/Cas system-associated exonuclease Cas4 (RecB family)
MFCAVSSTSALRQRAGVWLQSLPPHSEALVLGPIKAAADEFARTFNRAGLHRLTPTQLAGELAARRLAEQALAPTSRLGLEALTAHVVHRLRREGRLAYFRPVADTPGFARALAATLNELRLNAVPAETLAGSGEPGADLARLLTLYEQELRERKLADHATLLMLATEVAQHGAHRFSKLPLALLDVPLETLAHRRLAGALLNASPTFFAGVLQGDEVTLRALREITGEEPEPAHDGAGALDRVRLHLFSPERPPVAKPDETVELFSAPGEGLESVEIARRIQRLAAQGTRFDQVAILLRNPERYQPLVEEALRRAGIPAYLSRGSARPDPAGRAFLALLACAGENYSASRFAEYLSLAQVPKLDATGAPIRSEARWEPADDEVLAGFEPQPSEASPEQNLEDDEAPPALPIGWEGLLVDAAVVGGSDRWQRRLDGLDAELRAQIREVADDEGSRDRIERRIERLGRLRRVALPVIEALAGLPVRAAWGEWIEKLADLATLTLRRPESVLSTLADLKPMSEVGPADLDEVSGVLSERLRFLRRDPPGRRYGYVFVGTIEEARARVFDVVFLPGLTEGLFPRRALEDPLLLDSYRSQLSAALVLQDDRVTRERLLLRIAAAAPVRHFIASYSSIDVAQGRQRVPSFYALEIVRAAEGQLPHLDELKHRAARGASVRLGWPAPRDARDAIDDAEYDLASLDAALGLPAGKAHGRGAFLLNANPHLARSLRARWKRWKKAWTTADGLVDPDETVLRALAAHRLSNRSWSASALQQYSACPYRFLLYGIYQLRLREQSTPLDQMDPLTRGALFHAAQFALLTELQQAKKLPLDPQTLPKALDIADAVLNRVAAEFADKFVPAIPRVWNTEVEDLRTDLRGWLHQLAAQEEWEPAYFEFAFGPVHGGAHDPASSTQEALVHGARLRGSIDLIEKSRSSGQLRITDHKTGKAPDQPPVYVGGGALLQPLLYALVAERILGSAVESSRLWYCTQRGNYTQVEIPISDRARGCAGRVLQIVDESIAGGFLPAAPNRDACRACDFRIVCGPYEELRTQRKPKARLDALVELRGMP